MTITIDIEHERAIAEADASAMGINAGLEHLTALYADWRERHDMPDLSADELLVELRQFGDGAFAEARWLSCFLAIWECVEDDQ